MKNINNILHKVINVRTEYIMALVLLTLIVVVGSFSYALYTTSNEKKGALSIVTGNLNSLIESTAFNDSKQVSVAANTTTTFTIKLSNTNSIQAKFNLYYESSDATNTTINYLSTGDAAPGSEGIVLPKYNDTGYSKSINVKVTNKSTTTAITITFGSDVTLYNQTLTIPSGKSVLELLTLFGTDTSSANAPVLIGDMIPVTYDDTSSSWVKAATTQTGWYNYDTQNWANAVTISDTSKRATYKSAAVGTVISMDDINAMFVWIPRYSYTIGNTYGVQGYGESTPSQATPGAIDIKFVPTSTTDTGTATYTGSTASNYYTSPAFCWGDTCDSSRTDATNVEKSGIWVAKFETTAGASSTCTTSSSEANCNLSTIVPVIKPNIASWRNVNVANMFTAIQTNMNSTNGTTNYGFSGTTYDTHMMKNTEWGAVAYLSQSKYGKYGNTTYSGVDKEVAINNCSTFITGIAGDTVSASSSSTTCTTNTYNTTKGITASTTGNISGIYDMSGGSWEYVMGNMQISGNTVPEVGWISTYTSGFAGKSI
jgi:hypothetical protein